MIELPPAVVGYVDPFHPVFEGDARVLGCGNTFDHERNWETLFDSLHRLPVEAGLEGAALDPAAARGDEALGDVALAPAVMGGIDGKTESRIVVLDCALHMIIYPGGVAPHIEL